MLNNAFVNRPLKDSKDQSIPVDAKGDANSTLKQGNLRQILDCSRMDDGKVLNALSFPMRNAGIQNEAFSSDVASWNKTEAEPICKHEASMPIGDIRWGTCATCGAFHTYHIDSEGLGTTSELLFGLKWWIVPSNTDGENLFSRLDVFMNDKFDIDSASGDLWNLEAVVLVPGTKL